MTRLEKIEEAMKITNFLILLIGLAKVINLKHLKQHQGIRH